MSVLPSPVSIDKDAFAELLEQYQPLLESISASKAKDGQRTLASLDEYRYTTAVSQFGPDGEKRGEMGLDELKTLVEWKLSHGKFRPTLLALVSSNATDTVLSTIRTAIEEPTAKGVATLSKLKGIGPATASLVLAVHNPTQAPFFSDEVFWWLCCDGKKGAPIKYTAKEYEALLPRAKDVAERLSVSMADVEKVAFVVMKSAGEAKTAAAASPSVPASESATTSAKDEESGPSEEVAEHAAAKVEGKKNKQDNVDEEPPAKKKRASKKDTDKDKEEVPKPEPRRSRRLRGSTP